jgi:mono/diheme cytochrome c family protein
MNQNIRRIKVLAAALFSLSAIILIAACEKYTFTPPAVDPNFEWSLATDIQPIFTANCISCHGGVISPDLRADKSFDALTTGGYVSTPAAGSELYTVMASASHDARSSATDKLKVFYWITQGAKNN